MLVVSASALAQTPCPAERAANVRVGDQRFLVEVAATDATRLRGLSGRERLVPDTGMWFVPQEVGEPGFWMRDMRFPIDLIWVSPERKAVGSATLPVCLNAPCPISYPPSPVAYVLEIEAGRFRGRVGDTVTWTCEKTTPRPVTLAPTSSRMP
jgi:hypothetical protein